MLSDRGPDVAAYAVGARRRERGVHLFVEKPLANTWDGVEGLLAKYRGKVVSLGWLQYALSSRAAHVKRLLAENGVGRIIAARVEAGQYLPDWHPWEDYRQSYSARAISAAA